MYCPQTQQLFPKAKLWEIVAVEGTINLISSGQSVNTRKFFIILKKTFNYLTAMMIFLIVNKLEISDFKFYVPTRSVLS